MVKSRIRRVVGVPELLSLSGSWLVKRGKRLTGAAVIIASGAAVADLIGTSVFGYDIPVSKLNMAMIPAAAAGVTFGIGGTMNYAAKLLSGADRVAAEANSVCEVREMKHGADASKRQAEDLWDRVGQYEVPIFKGNNKSHWTSKEDFVNRVAYVLDEPLPHIVQMGVIDFDVSSVEAFRNCEIFESTLMKEYASNRFLKGVRKKANLSVWSGIGNVVRGIGDEVLRNLTRNKMYMMAGKEMNYLNSNVEGSPFDAQPFIWMTDELEEEIRKYDGDVFDMVVRDRKNIKDQVFGDNAKANSHIYDCFDADYLKALRLRLGFDVEYAAGLLEQKPKDDVGVIRDLVGKRVLKDKVLEKYEEVAKRSLDESYKLGLKFERAGARAVNVGCYTNVKSVKNRRFASGLADKAREYSDELVQMRIHDYLAREQIEFHCGLVERLGDSKV